MKYRTFPKAHSIKELTELYSRHTGSSPFSSERSVLVDRGLEKSSEVLLTLIKKSLVP